MVEKMSQSYATQPYQKLLNEPPLDKSGPQPKTPLIASLCFWIWSKMPGIWELSPSMREVISVIFANYFRVEGRQISCTLTLLHLRAIMFVTKS